MFPIALFLNAYLRAAAMSDRSDGDCVLGRSSEAEIGRAHV
mgnify:CR=1 FL=1